MQTVFHLISADSDEQKTTLTLAENLATDENVEVDDIVVVAQSKGIEPLTTGGGHEDKLRSLMNQGVRFMGCGNTLDMMEMDESNLVDGVEVASSGISELARLQHDGYAYIRP